MDEKNTTNAPFTLFGGFAACLLPGQWALAFFITKWSIGVLRPLVQSNIPDLLAESGNLALMEYRPR